MIRPAKITWAAAMLLFGGAIALTLGIVSFYVPDEIRSFSIFTVVIGSWGIATGIGLLRLWRWARISVLILSGLSAYCGIALAPVLLFVEFPFPPTLHGQITPAEFMWGIRVFGVLLVLCVAIGFWWAYLFGSSTVKGLFGVSEPARLRPFSISVLGWYFVISAAERALDTAVTLFLGGSLLYRRIYSRTFAIYYLLFECLNITVFLLRPGREARLAAYHDMLHALHPNYATTTATLSQFMKTTSIEWAIIFAIMPWFLAKQDSAPDLANS